MTELAPADPPAELAAFAALMAGLYTGGSPHQAVRALLGEQGLLWRCCAAAVQEDPSWITDGHADEAIALITERLTGTVDEVRAALMSASTIVHVTKALCAPAHKVPDLVHRSTTGWDAIATIPPRPVGAALIDAAALHSSTNPGLEAVVTAAANLGDDRSGALITLTALLLARPSVSGRHTAQCAVVFGRPGTSGPGVAGTLEMREIPGGPAGLFPDPKSMSGVRTADEAFTQALRLAWETSSGRYAGRCVVWRLTTDAIPVPSVEGNSLGAAMALTLRDLLRRPPHKRMVRAWLRFFTHRFFNRPRTATAVTGGIDADERLVRVDMLEAKLSAAQRKGWQLVAPQPNQPHLGPGHDTKTVDFAADLSEAAALLRRFRRGPTASVIIAGAALSLVGYGVYAIGADAAQRQKTVDQLVQQSLRYLDTDIATAQLLAVRAYRERPDRQTATMLFRAVYAAPYLARLQPIQGTLSTLATSTDGGSIFAGTQEGTLLRWRPPQRPAIVAGALPGSVTLISANATGTSAVMITGGQAKLWTEASGTTTLKLPDQSEPYAITMSPSGRSVVVAAKSLVTGNTSTSLTLYDPQRGTQDSLTPLAGGSQLDMPDDSELVELGTYSGNWARISLPGKSILAVGGLATDIPGSRYATFVLANGGRHLARSDIGTATVWKTQRQGRNGSIQEHDITTQSGSPSLLALSADGTQIAEPTQNGIDVFDTTAGVGHRQPLELRGVPTATGSNLSFLGRQRDRLVSGGGSTLALWNLRQFARPAAVYEAKVRSGCTACSPPFLAVQPHGSKVAVVDGFGWTGAIYDPEHGRLPAWTSELTNNLVLAPPVWYEDGSSLLRINAQDGSATAVTADGIPVSAIQWPAPPNNGPKDMAAGIRAVSGKRLAEIHASGTAELRDLTDGRSLRSVPGPREMGLSSSGGSPERAGSAAIQADGSHAAIINTRDGDQPPFVFVANLQTGTSRRIPGENPSGVAYLAHHLIVQRQDGTLEIWDADGANQERMIRTTPASFGGIVTDDRTTIVQMRADGRATVTDYVTGQTMGDLLMPEVELQSKTGIAFSPDGHTLASITEGDGELILWSFDPEQWMRIACSTSGRDLTAQEWKQLIDTPAPNDLVCESS